ncbi:MAG: ATP phosphoribosyltransferase regulatory subunit [Oscillospiraceae bacterium]|nr:ATP phosphoribosyltransferase regulatory subunit [Oscillospiraceae bacterium]
MEIKNLVFEGEELSALRLGSLYRKYGYSQYKMSKFEEYDLYVRNKDFLISDSVITFTDTNGKLMALKPDVTLSIIKNSKAENGVKKVYYDENVYRVSGKTQSYKEIRQVGLECIGDVDAYCVCEVLSLAAASLKSISSDCVLDLSHIGIVSELVSAFGIDDESKKDVIRAFGEKNVHEASAVCKSCGVSEDKIDILKRLISMHGSPQNVLPELYLLVGEYVSKEALSMLALVTEQAEKNGFGDMLSIDFSVINDMKYYNGIVFKGFVKGVSEGVLSGGQYDNLMQRMNKKAGAIGFAVYLDMLSSLSENTDDFDVDTVVVYSQNTSVDEVADLVRKISDEGKTVLAVKNIPDKLRYREKLILA